MARRFALLVALALAAHATSIADGFVFDDSSAIVANESVTGPLSLGQLIHDDFWGRAATHPESVGTWRPLPTLTFWVDWHLGGGRPWLFHAVNVLWHALAALLLALALRDATGDPQLALLAGGLFAVLAANSEAVASLVGRADVMATAFSLAAWWLWRRSVAGACAAYVAACLCKESAIVLPVWLAAVEWILRPALFRRRAAAFAALAVAGGAYALARTFWFAPFSHVMMGHYNNLLLGESRAVRLWTGMRLFVLTLRVMLVPLNLVADYSGAEIQPNRHFAWEPLAGALAIALLIVAVLRLRRRDPAIAAGIALFLIPWLMISNIVVLLPTIFAERLLYMPAAGATLVLARLAQRLGERRRALAIALVVFVGAGNLALAVAADRMWRSNLSLFAAAVEVSPTAPRAWFNYATELRKHGERAAAEAAFRESLRLGFSERAAAGVGELLEEAGQTAEAERYFHAAVERPTENRTVVKNAAVFYGRHGHWSEASVILHTWLARHPGDAELTQMLTIVDKRRNAPGPGPGAPP